MFENYYRSFVYSMGVESILFIILSLVFPEIIKINHLYFMVCVLIPVHGFSFLTFELKLFSERIWVRRTIVMAFSILVLFVSGYISGALHLELKSLIIYCVTALLCILATVFAFYVADKIEQQNLKLINQKLDEKKYM